MVREYAKWMGIVIVLIGLGGLVLGEQALLGVLNIDIVEDLIHVLTGGLMAYVGFRGTTAAARAVVGGTGAFYLVAFLLGLTVPNLFGLLPHGYSGVDNFIHVTLGVLGVAVAWFLGRETSTGPQGLST